MIVCIVIIILSSIVIFCCNKIGSESDKYLDEMIIDFISKKKAEKKASANNKDNIDQSEEE